MVTDDVKPKYWIRKVLVGTLAPWSEHTCEFLATLFRLPARANQALLDRHELENEATQARVQVCRGGGSAKCSGLAWNSSFDDTRGYVVVQIKHRGIAMGWRTIYAMQMYIQVRMSRR